MQSALKVDCWIIRADISNYVSDVLSDNVKSATHKEKNEAYNPQTFAVLKVTRKRSRSGVIASLLDLPTDDVDPAYLFVFLECSPSPGAPRVHVITLPRRNTLWHCNGLCRSAFNSSGSNASAGTDFPYTLLPHHITSHRPGVQWNETKRDRRGTEGRQRDVEEREPLQIASWNTIEWFEPRQRTERWQRQWEKRGY